MFLQLDDKDKTTNFLQPLIKKVSDLTDESGSTMSLSKHETKKFIDSAINEIKSKDQYYFDNLHTAMVTNDDAKALDILKSSKEYINPYFESSTNVETIKKIERSIDDIAIKHFIEKGPTNKNKLISFVKATADNMDNILADATQTNASSNKFIYFWPLIMFIVWFIVQSSMAVLTVCIQANWCGDWANIKTWY